MAICYSYILLLLFSLVIIHSIDSASLRFPVFSTPNRRNSSVMKSNYLISESTYPEVPLLRRLRRWKTNGDNDEVEIPLDESILSTQSSDNDSTVLILKSTELNSSITEIVDYLINSTIVSEISSDENVTTKYPLLRADLTELNQTTDSIIDEVSQENNTTVPETLAANITDVNQVVLDDKNDSTTDRMNVSIDEIQSSSVPIIANRTTDQMDSNTTVVLSESSTILPNPTENNPANDWGFTFNESSIITINDESIINSNISQKDAIIPIDQDISMNDTEIIIIKTTVSSSLSPKPSTVPVCDYDCLCLKECPYGFEIVNDTCLCSPPCQNYQCFGNDTCIVTNEGQPLCQRENGTEYDRPTGCYQPRDAGYHDVNMRYYNRWYYHPDQDACHLFVYRGLGGNQNNFRTLHECHSECITCAPKPDPGECLGHINMWYYDKKTSECREFEYSGCKGNDNKFFKKETCIDTCINRIANLK